MDVGGRAELKHTNQEVIVLVRPYSTTMVVRILSDYCREMGTFSTLMFRSVSVFDLMNASNLVAEVHCSCYFSAFKLCINFLNLFPSDS